MRESHRAAGLYLSAYHAIRNDWRFVTLLCGMLVLLVALSESLEHPILPNIAAVFIYVAVAYRVHKAILFKDSDYIKYTDWALPSSYIINTRRGFFWRSWILVVLTFLASFGLAMTAWIFWRDLVPDDNLRVELLGFSLRLFHVPIAGIILPLFGTIFPATVANGDKSLKTALARGKKTYWFTLSRLLLGPFAFSVLVGTAPFFLLDPNMPMSIFSNEGSIVAAGLGVTILDIMFSIFVTALTATVLCKAYLRYEQGPEQTQDAT